MPIYMKFDGIEGDVTAAGHENWIELQSAGWGSSRNISTSGDAAQRTKATVQVREVVVTKERDHASGKLWREHLIGTPKKVEINWTVTSQGAATVFQAIKLTDVLVSSFTSSGHADSKPMEQLSFNFTEIEGTFYDMVQAGTKASKPFIHGFKLKD